MGAYFLNLEMKPEEKKVNQFPLFIIDLTLSKSLSGISFSKHKIREKKLQYFKLTFSIIYDSIDFCRERIIKALNIKHVFN